MAADGIPAPPAKQAESARRDGGRSERCGIPVKYRLDRHGNRVQSRFRKSSRAKNIGAVEAQPACVPLFMTPFFALLTFGDFAILA
jgi:hypothetical protein